MPAFADDVINPGFETGDATGWTMSGGYWHSGTWPPPESEYSGPATEASIQDAGNVDVYTGDPVVFAGNHSMRLNDLNNDYSITAMKQTIANYSGNKLYYAWNAALEPSHGETDSPSFIIKVTDKTTNTVVNNISYSAYTAQNTTVFRPAGFLVTSDWKVEEIDMISGHDYEMLFIALDCPYGGHRGYVYVDGFGNAIPVANADVDFDPTTDITRGSDILIPIGGTPDIDTAKPFYTTTELAGGLVNPKFVGGTLQSDTAADVTKALAVDTAGGTIDTNGFDVTYSGGFAGVGGLTKIGEGKATLNSFATTINESFAVNAGTLAVDDLLSAHSVNVNEGGTLSGIGGVVADLNVNAGGTLAPGDTIGALTVVAGDVVLDDASTFALDIDGKATITPDETQIAGDGAGSYDRVVLMSDATFAPNGTLAINLRDIPGGNNTFTPAVGDTFTVVAGGPVTNGAFDAVTQPSAGMAPNTRFDVLYMPTSVVLAVTPGNFATWGTAHDWKVNAISAAAGLDPFRPRAGARSGDFYGLFSGLYGMTSPQLGFAFSQISGEVHADAMQMAQSAAREVGQIALGAAQEPWGCSVAPQTANDPGDPTPRKEDEGCGVLSGNKGATVWGQYIGQRMSADEDHIAYGYSGNVDGLIAGVNVLNRDGMRLGIGGSWSKGGLDSDVVGSTDQKTLSGFLYGARRFGPISIGALLSYSSTDVDAVRTVGLTSGTVYASDGYKIKTIEGALEARYDIPLGARAVVRPLVGFEYAHTKANSVSEVGSAKIALELPSESWNSARSKLGAEVAVGVGNPVEAGLYGNWRHEFNDATATRVARLGAASWIVSSVAAKDDTFEAGAKLGIKVGEAVKFRIDFGLVRGGAYDYERAMAGVAILF